MEQEKSSEENETMGEVHEIVEVEPVEPKEFMHPVRGIKQILNNCILTYIPDFDGVLLCYRNVKSMTVAVPHIDSVPYSYFSGEADLYIFRPIVGTNIVAEIATVEVENSIVTVLIKGCFNGRVIVPKETVKTVAQGQYIRFKVTTTEYKRGNYIVSGDYIEAVETKEEVAEE